jgi:hypothetical protein
LVSNPDARKLEMVNIALDAFSTDPIYVNVRKIAGIAIS